MIYYKLNFVNSVKTVFLVKLKNILQKQQFCAENQLVCVFLFALKHGIIRMEVDNHGY